MQAAAQCRWKCLRHCSAQHLAVAPPCPHSAHFFSSVALMAGTKDCCKAPVGGADGGAISGGQHTRLLEGACGWCEWEGAAGRWTGAVGVCLHQASLQFRGPCSGSLSHVKNVILSTQKRTILGTHLAAWIPSLTGPRTRALGQHCMRHTCGNRRYAMIADVSSRVQGCDNMQYGGERSDGQWQHETLGLQPVSAPHMCRHIALTASELRPPVKGIALRRMRLLLCIKGAHRLCSTHSRW